MTDQRPVRPADQKKIRVQLAVWAFAYEVYSHSFVTDSQYDKQSLLVDLSIATDREDLDSWFKDNYSPYTGQWVLEHPEKDRLNTIVQGLIELDNI